MTLLISALFAKTSKSMTSFCLYFYVQGISCGHMIIGCDIYTLYFDWFSLTFVKIRCTRHRKVIYRQVRSWRSTAVAMTWRHSNMMSTNPDVCLFATSLDYVSHVGKCLLLADENRCSISVHWREDIRKCKYLRIKSLFFNLHNVMKTVAELKIHEARILATTTVFITSWRLKNKLSLLIFTLYF